MNKEELTTLPMPQGTSHCSCLEHCFLLNLEHGHETLIGAPVKSHGGRTVPHDATVRAHLQTTCALLSLKPSSQTVPQRPSW